jgi:hypothetical protein
LIIFDFKCPAGHLFERYVTSDTFETPCKECSETAKRQIASPTFVLNPHSGGFPGAALKWAREHEKGSKKYT